MLRQAVEAVDGATLCWLEGDLALFSAVRTGDLGHLSRAAATKIPGTATLRSAKSSVIHLRLLSQIALQGSHQRTSLISLRTDPPDHGDTASPFGPSCPLRRVDALGPSIYRERMTCMLEDSSTVARHANHMMVPRYLERSADTPA